VGRPTGLSISYKTWTPFGRCYDPNQGIGGSLSHRGGVKRVMTRTWRKRKSDGAKGSIVVSAKKLANSPREDPVDGLLRGKEDHGPRAGTRRQSPPSHVVKASNDDEVKILSSEEQSGVDSSSSDEDNYINEYLSPEILELANMASGVSDESDYVEQPIRPVKLKKEQKSQKTNKKDKKDEKTKKAERDEEDSTTYYYVPGLDDYKKLMRRYPFLRWTNKYRDGDFYPPSPYFVGAYHWACRFWNYDPNCYSPHFRLNHFDLSQFQRSSWKTLCLDTSTNGDALISTSNPKYLVFGHCASIISESFKCTAKTPEGDGTLIKYDSPVGTTVLCPKARADEMLKNIIADAIHQARGKVRDEKLRLMLTQRFNWICKAYGAEPAQFLQHFDLVYDNVIKHDEYAIVPRHYTEWCISIFKKNGVPGITVLEPFMRALNPKGAFDDMVHTYLQKCKFDKGHVLVGDLLKFLSTKLDLGEVVYDVCGLDLCQKKITYLVDIEDLAHAYLKLCQPRVAYVRCGPSLPDYKPQVSRGCIHSSVNALQTRFVCDHEKINAQAHAIEEAHVMFRNELYRQLADNTFVLEELTYEEFIDSMAWPGKMKAEARVLAQEFVGDEIAWLDTKTRAFAKWEELKNKAPINTRLIQGFSLGFCLITGRMIKSLYSSLKKVFGGDYGTFSIGSMMSNEGIGRRQQFAEHDGLHTIDLDGDSYDSTMRRDRAFAMYDLLSELSGYESDAISLLRRCRKITGSLFTHGIKYCLPKELWNAGIAPMASGETDTTLLNSLLRLEEGFYYAKMAGANRCLIMASGDDLRINSDCPITSDKVMADGSALGRIEKIESLGCKTGVFLRKRFYPVGKILVPGMQIGRALSRACWVRGDIPARLRTAVMRGDAIGRLKTDNHVPLIREFALRMLVLLGDGKSIEKYHKSNREYNEIEKIHNYDEETLDFVCDTYDISRQELQEAIEYISELKLDSDLDHPVIRKIFLVDVPSVEPTREGLVTDDATYQLTSDVFSMNLAVPTNDSQPRDFSRMITGVIAEEIVKSAVYFVLPDFGVFWALLVSVIYSIFESHTPWGVFLPDLMVRVVFHLGMTVLGRHTYFCGGIIIHVAHNFLSSKYFVAHNPLLWFTTMWKMIFFYVQFARIIVEGVLGLPQYLRPRHRRVFRVVKFGSVICPRWLAIRMLPQSYHTIWWLLTLYVGLDTLMFNVLTTLKVAISHWVSMGCVLFSTTRHFLVSTAQFAKGVKFRTIPKSKVRSAKIIRATKVISRTVRPRLVVTKTKPKKKSRGKRFDAYEAGHYNPFLSDISGVRVPDEHTYPTATITLRANGNVGALSDGTLGAAYRPSIKKYFGVQTLVEDSKSELSSIRSTRSKFEKISPPEKEVTLGASEWKDANFFDLPQMGALEPIFSGFRVVCGGIRLTTELPLTEAAGHILVAHVPDNISDDPEGRGYWPVSETAAMGFPLVERWPIAELCTKPLVVPFKRLGPASYFFRDLDAAQTSRAQNIPMGTGWCDVLIFGSGLPVSASTVLCVEYILHIELTHGHGDTLGFDSGFALVNRASLDRTTVLQQMSPVAHVVDEGEAMDGFSVMDRIENFIKKATRVASTAASAYVGGRNMLNHISGSYASRPTSYLMYQ